MLITQDQNTLTAQQIVDIFLGTGVTVSNITITGDPRAIGSFVDETRDGIGISEGIILSSGNIKDATGPNSSDGKTTGFDTPGDADLNKLLPSGQETNDAVILEFDFIPKNEQFLFEYVWASDEYNEFANSAFNDIFAFFLNGENIALIPGTNTPVSINNINATDNSAFFRNNDFGDLNPPYPYNTEFDGFTTTFAASALVTPNQKQHLKIAVADVSDSILDSAVFLKKGSLSTLGNVESSLSINDVTITEGNNNVKNATFTVTLTGTTTNQITVDYATGNDTATNEDYTSTSGTLTFAANETTQTITVPIIGDTDIESDETFFVNLSNPQNATIADGQGLGTITNDDSPAVVFDDVTIVEGNTSLTFSGAGASRIEANSSNSLTNRIYAGSGNDTLRGSGDDNLFGGDGNDSLTGNGRDRLFGGQGNDTLTGETGLNLLVAGAGQDVFLFNSTSKDQDIILDFTSEEGDKINLNSTAFNLPIGTLQSDLFVLGNTATNSAHRFIFNSENNTLFFDSDGTGATVQKAIAVFSNNIDLNVSDIIIV